MNKVKTNKISRYALSLIAVATLSCSSLSFSMNIFQAIRNKNIKRVAEILENTSFDVNKVDNNNGQTPLYWACYTNNLEIVTLLLAKDVQKSVNKADNGGKTPLYFACENNNLDIATLLLNNGAKESVNKADKYGRTPLFWACSKKNPKLVELLLARGANVDQMSLNSGQSKPEILKLLKERSSIKK